MAQEFLHWTGKLRREFDAPFRRKSLLFWLISPISLVVSLLWGLISAWKRSRGYVDNTFSFPIICCGNILVGGSGKSPVVRALAEYFLERGFLVLIIGRGINTKEHNFFVGYNLPSGLVELQSHSRKELSDENLEHLELLERKMPKGRALVFQGAKRTLALEYLRAYLLRNPQDKGVAILDDGLTSFKTPRSRNLCLWNPYLLATAPAFAIPLGPYREGFPASFERLLETSADARLWSRCTEEHLEGFIEKARKALARFGITLGKKDIFLVARPMFFKVTYSTEGNAEPVWVSLTKQPLGAEETLSGKMQDPSKKEISFLCVTGIANNEEFFKQVTDWFSLSPQSTERVSLQDHGDFVLPANLQDVGLTHVVTTAKDFFRWGELPSFKTFVKNKSLIVATVEVNFWQADSTPAAEFIREFCGLS